MNDNLEAAVGTQPGWFTLGAWLFFCRVWPWRSSGAALPIGSGVDKPCTGSGGGPGGGNPRRYWLGAVLGILITWGGGALLLLKGLGIAVYLSAACSIGSLELALSWLILLCNVSMVLTWLMPAGQGRQ